MPQQTLMRIISVLLFSVVFFGFLYSVNKDVSKDKLLYSIESNQENKDKSALKLMKRTLVETIWCEDRSSAKSMELVLSVIYNRAKEKTLKQLYTSAVKPYQFSCLNEPNTIKKQKLNSLDQVRYTQAIAIVDKFVTGKFKPITKATFYYATNKVAKPSYLNERKLVLVFGNHHFYL